MDNQKDTKGKEQQEDRKVRVRITLSCKNLKNIEKVQNGLISNAKGCEGVSIRGPVRLPLKNLKITTRKTPCGEGSKTWDKFELRIYKRVIDFNCLVDDIKKITDLKVDPGVEVELTVQNE